MCVYSKGEDRKVSGHVEKVPLPVPISTIMGNRGIVS